MSGGGSSVVNCGGAGNGVANGGKMMWQWSVEEVGAWVRSVQALHPLKPEKRIASAIAESNAPPVHNNGTQPLTTAQIAAMARAKAEESMRRTQEAARQRQLDAEAEQKWQDHLITAKRVTENLLKALESASMVENKDAENGRSTGGKIGNDTGTGNGSEMTASWKDMEMQMNVQQQQHPQASAREMTPAERYEKMKTAALVAAGVVPPPGKGVNQAPQATTLVSGQSNSLNPQRSRTKVDAYNILDSSFAKGKDIVHLPGAILSRLGMGGLVNALSGVEGGVVDPATNIPLPIMEKGNANAKASGKQNGDKVHTVAPDVKNFARLLRRSVAARLEMDMLEATPGRIVEMLCPEVSLPEIMAIRRRIYDTVILGRGTNASAQAAALESTEDLPVAAKTSVHDVEKWKKCKECGNNDQSGFVMDKKNGDMICTNCGTVAAESLMHEGSQFRKFEGEVDRNHHGDAANPLYSNAHNMSTTLGGMGFQSGAGVGWGMGSKKGMENVLRNAHAYTEMNISQLGKEEKKTRIGYKDRQKKDAFVRMTHVGDALNLHDAVVQRAKELFAGFRDDRELVQQFKGVVAACLCEAFEQLSNDGRKILKVRAGDGDGEGDDESLTTRASWRNNMHKSTAASTTVLSDMPDHLKEVLTNGTKADIEGVSQLELKPAAWWDIDDCRSWLLEASRSIARQWCDAREADASLAAALPKGSLDELEGKLVEHTFALCDTLEQELNKARDKAITGGGRQRVNTPRVAEMGHLSIRWQGSHERGSGGKGGVGNSGRTLKGTKPGERDSKTAGQILLLKSAKKLSAIIKDSMAGEAFHRELRSLLGRQYTRKRKNRSNEVAQQRFQQMKRKPWLNARAKAN